MQPLFLTILLLSGQTLSGPKVAARLSPDPRARTWVRGAPLPDVNTPSTILALSFMESSLFPSSTGKSVSRKAPKRKLPAELSWLKGMRYPDIPVTFDSRTIKYLKWFRFDRTGRNVIRAWIERSGKYRAMIIDTLKRHRLPTALMYIALIESGFVKTTRSWAGALGLWQFMPSGTKVYGLSKSYWIDQRIDPELSTEAVVLYFADLHYRFKDWALAMGAYNCGYGRMLQSMRRYGTNDYFRLSTYENALPRETRLYVPKMIAVAIADLNRGKFGLNNLKMATPYAFDTIYAPAGARLSTLAQVTGIDEKRLWEMNREYIRRRLPPVGSRWPVRIPKGTLNAVSRRLHRKVPGWERLSTYTITLGDTLPSVARLFGTSTARLRTLNGMKSSTELRMGLTIVVPGNAAHHAKLEPVQEKPLVSIPADTVTPRGYRTYFYRTTRSDTLETIARGLGVTPEELTAWNLLAPDANITYHMVLLVHLPEKRKPHHALLTQDRVQLMRIDREAFFAHYLKKTHKVRVIHTVRRGETLKKLARRYGTTRRFIRSLNHFSGKEITKGQRLIVYSKASKAPRTKRNTRPVSKKSDRRPAAPPSKTLEQKKALPSPGRRGQPILPAAGVPGKTQAPPVPYRKVAPSLVTNRIEEPLVSPYIQDLSSQRGVAWSGQTGAGTSRGKPAPGKSHSTIHAKTRHPRKSLPPSQSAPKKRRAGSHHVSPKRKTANHHRDVHRAKERRRGR